MFIIVQWFSLLLKIDIYFEFSAYALLFSYNAGFPEFWNDQGPIEASLYIMLIIMILTLPSLVLARLSVSSESKLMMISFIVFQLLFIASTVFIAIVNQDLMKNWYAFATYSKWNYIMMQSISRQHVADNFGLVFVFHRLGCSCSRSCK